jgi:ADP-ribose pyrophosphatase YjhB (NUDIX family)
VPVDRSSIRLKAMLIAPNDNLTAHAVSVNPPTAENRDGYHRLIGGSVELGESHRDAIVREVYEELGAVIRNLDFLATVDNVFRINGSLGHEVVFLYSGRLDPPPVTANATLTESDGSVVPVVWRSFLEADEPLPLYPSAAVAWVRHLRDPNVRAGSGPLESQRVGIRRVERN